MKRFIVFVCFVTLCSLSQALSQAHAAVTSKPCGELKAEIEAKIEANGVQSYVVTIVGNEEIENRTAVDGKIVGSCEGGTKKILYTKNPKPAEPHDAAESFTDEKTG
ncbi:MAG: DUF1161 domain-containing protein [Candidatus Electrothrix sp. MAN1_4]|nr:DUF1161 domain-containing protein [Candidatus Electrothrix sp. MAN1_4]